MRLFIIVLLVFVHGFAMAFVVVEKELEYPFHPQNVVSLKKFGQFHRAIQPVLDEHFAWDRLSNGQLGTWVYMQDGGLLDVQPWVDYYFHADKTTRYAFRSQMAKVASSYLKQLQRVNLKSIASTANHLRVMTFNEDAFSLLVQTATPVDSILVAGTRSVLAVDLPQIPVDGVEVPPEKNPILLISNSLLDVWGMNIDSLWAIALRNTLDLWPKTQEKTISVGEIDLEVSVLTAPQFTTAHIFQIEKLLPDYRGNVGMLIAPINESALAVMRLDTDSRVKAMTFMEGLGLFSLQHNYNQLLPVGKSFFWWKDGQLVEIETTEVQKKRVKIKLPSALDALLH